MQLRRRSNGMFMVLAIAGWLAMVAQLAAAGQGCPFDDGSCQEYCGQQGCGVGYCGHFAWIQCICRKCGDQWYDELRLNPGKQVNQTELDSLKLSSRGRPAGGTSTPQPPTTKAPATTLLVPDLSDPKAKLELNDLPDESSDKFLDYLAKNHERLVQATHEKAAESQRQSEATEMPESDDIEDTTTGAPSNEEDELIEVQISSRNSSVLEEPAQQQQQPDKKDEPVLKSKLIELGKARQQNLGQLLTDRRADKTE